MNLQELTNRSLAGDIDEINLVSMEGDIYVLEARMGNRYYPVQDVLGHVLSVRSVAHARELLHALPAVPFHLVHAVVHDEMVGMQDERDIGDGVPIPLH
ncbi:DUF6482 family protein [Pseudomonas sp. ZM23]|uniref:DUF6482 family protein n=1 Tax=Pseudomonas triclosanedens TaxID=2961893 RepID=A0ABY7A0G4_9PSED|nr:DUF6482 family protein [Pseudomonas triclosanedens]MCP8463892.1 DUF6482 family protein [Pseudomonas triclosanedens]MCP8468976.1 DUF6482 family protein [Pseudomonas triclosanedens]MCP8475698.1 DUF6482 family protein [Pseudomonas triclosanedens]WAI50588.1 DUF6482 family protein [Pseudomonas triclosanedens]